MEFGAMFIASVQLPSRLMALRSRGLLALCLLTLTGCVTLPPGTNFDSPVRTEQTLPHKAWIGAVKFADESMENRAVLEDSLRGNITSYIQDADYFLEISTIPGKVGNDDLILDFRFDRYVQKRNTHPAYFPLALATLTLYIWFGGPIYVDESDLSGMLTVKNGAGNSLVQVSSQVHEEHNVSLWSSEYALPSGIKARSSMLQELMSKARADLRSKAHP